MRIIFVNRALLILLLVAAPLLIFFFSMNIAIGSLIIAMIVACAVCFKIEGPSYTRLFKKFRNDGEAVFRCRNQSLVLGLNDDCIAQFFAGKDNLLAWLDGPEQWPILALDKKSLFIPWYQVERVSMGLEGKEVLFKLEGGQELKWLPENEEERTRLFNAIQIASPSPLDLTKRKTFTLVYSGLIWFVLPMIFIGFQVIGRGAGWMDKPNAQDLAPQVGKDREEFIAMTFKVTQFITENIPGILWIPTGVLISGLSSWLLWKLIRRDSSELILSQANSNATTHLQANSSEKSG